ncbi:hypothetical protein C8Q75DRAFT_737444 [Abortiporus biennis]|nr:hypothetical protein C8Q75DRAFT_737444 [Abortiporus biennis]
MISWPSHTGLKRLISDHGSEMMAFQLHMMPAMMFYLGPQLVNPSFKFPVRKPYIIDLSNCPKLELVSIHLEVTPSQFEMADYYFMTTYMGDMLQTLPKDTPSSSPEIPTINRRLLLLVDLTNMDLPTLRTKFGEEEFFNWEKLDKSFEAFGKLNIWLRFKTIKAGRSDYRRGILPPPKVTIESLDDPEILDIFTKNLPSLSRFEDVFGGDPIGDSEA